MVQDFFIIYLALSLLISITKQQNDRDKIIPNSLADYGNAKDINNNNYFTVDQQYADDIGWASTGIHILENIEAYIPENFKK